MAEDKNNRVNNVKVNSASFGLNLDNSKQNLEYGEYSWALNAIIQSDKGDSIQTEEANILCQSLPIDKQNLFIIGSINIDESTVIFLTNDTESEIGIFDKFCNYTTIINDSCLNFNLQNQIKGVARTNNLRCGRTIYWCDNHHNPMRYLDIDNVTFPFDCEKLRIFPAIGDPCINLINVISGGVLHSGVYQFLIQYSDIDGNPLSTFYGLTDVVSVYKTDINQAWSQIDGGAPDTITSKAIQISVDNLNTIFQAYNIAVIKTINGISTSFIVATLPITQTTYIYTGNENTTPITTTDIVAKPSVYTGAKDVIQTQRRIVWGNLTGITDYNFQLYANKITVKWQEYRIKYNNLSLDYKNPLSSAYRKSFLRDEIYALGIVLKFDDGTESCTYHIPGRPINRNSGDTEPIIFIPTADPLDSSNIIPVGQWDTQTVLSSNNDNYEGINEDRWKVYNTAIITGSDSLDTNGEGWYQYGEMSAYQSETGVYPNLPSVWGNLANQPIRHHKFPDATIIPILDSDEDLADDSGEYPVVACNQAIAFTDIDYVPYINLLGIRLENINAIIQQAINDNIIPATVIGWDLVRSDRRYEKTIIAKGVLYNGRLYHQWGEDSSDDKVFPNYPFNSLVADNLYTSTGIDEVTYNSNHFSSSEFTIESPSTSFSKPLLTVSELKIEANYFGPSSMRWQDAKDARPVSNDNEVDNPALVSWGIGKYNRSILPFKTSVRRKLTECRNVASNQIDAAGNLKTINNIHGASITYLGVTQSIGDIGSVGVTKTEGDNRRSFFDVEDFVCSGFNTYTCRCSSYYASIKNPIKSIYNDLESINYIKIASTCDIKTDPVRLLGGDTFITFYATKRKHGFFNNYSNESSKEYTHCSGDWLIDFPATYVTISGDDIKPQILGNRWCGDDHDDTHQFFKSVLDQGGTYKTIDGIDGPTLADNGRYYLFVTGVAGFWVESEINTELRYDKGTLDTFYYPKIDTSSSDVQNWLNRSCEADSVAGADMGYFNEDSSWLYNFDYSTINDKHQYCIYPLSTTFEDTCTTTYPQREIWSEEANNEQTFDAYLQYLSTSYFDYPKEDGELWSMFSTQGILFTRLVNGIYKLQLNPQELETNVSTVNIGVPGFFELPPVKLSEFDNGYGGTQSQWALNSTPFGVFMADQNSGKVFQLSAQLNEISANKAFFFFRENLISNLRNQVDSILGDGTYKNFDNPANLNGTGLLSAFDSKYNRWILTKKDYLLKTPELLENGKIIYENGKFLYKPSPDREGTVISFSDTNYFCNKSFTISYYPVTQRWVSFHSYLPGFYISQKYDFYSWLNNMNNLGGYKHNDECTFHTYYGQIKPFIVEIPTKLDKVDTYTEPSFTWTQMTFKCVNGTTEEISNLDTTFNKAYVYNDDEHSGNLNLKMLNLNDLSTLFNLPKINIDSTDIQIVKKEQFYSFNEFWDLVDHTKSLNINTDNCNDEDFISNYPIDQVPNNQAILYNKDWSELQRFRGKYNAFRLILDNNNDTRLVCSFFINYPKYSYS